jgi:hypothetical protein
MQKETISHDDEVLSTGDVKGFVGMDTEETSNESGRTTEEVRKARLANTETSGGTHGGSKSPEGKEHHDKGGKEGNNGAHPF